jgi:hypothetical protein
VQGVGDPGILCEGTIDEIHTVPAERRGCPLRLWNNKVPPKCGETYNFPGLLVRDPENPAKSKVDQVILQLRSAASIVGKQMITKVYNEGDRVWHNVVFELGVQSKTNANGLEFFNPVADVFDLTSAPGWERIRRRAEQMATNMGASSLQASMEDDVE